MSKMLEDLEEVVRLAEKATPGPWLYRPKSNSWHKPPPEGTNYSYGEFIVGMDSDSDDEGNGYDEAFLIAAIQFMSTHHATIRDMAKDAARYRWLRVRMHGADGMPFIARCHGGRFSLWNNDDADQVIDESMQESTP